MTIDEILDLIDETKTADEAANFLIERLGDQSLEVSQDIANIFKSSENLERHEYWTDVSKIIDKNTAQDNHRWPTF